MKKEISAACRANLLTDHLKTLHRWLRQEKIQMILSLAAHRGSLLDVGGGTGVDGEFLPLYEMFRVVHTLNLNLPEEPSPSTRIIADGCLLPYRDRSFDWVFCNAVIEHLPLERQALLASEIRRVAAEGYLLATPDRYFPIDPHTLLPGYHLLPRKLRRICRCLSLRPDREGIHEMNLISAQSLRQLFPEARILRRGLPLWPNNLLAVYCRNLQEGNTIG